MIEAWNRRARKDLRVYKAARKSYRAGHKCYLEYTPGNRTQINLYWQGKAPRTRKAFEGWIFGEGTQNDMAQKYGCLAATLGMHGRVLRLMGLVRFKK